MELDVPSSEYGLRMIEVSFLLTSHIAKIRQFKFFIYNKMNCLNYSRNVWYRNVFVILWLLNDWMIESSDRQTRSKVRFCWQSVLSIQTLSLIHYCINCINCLMRVSKYEISKLMCYRLNVSVLYYFEMSEFLIEIFSYLLPYIELYIVWANVLLFKY